MSEEVFEWQNGFPIVKFKYDSFIWWRKNPWKEINTDKLKGKIEDSDAIFDVLKSDFAKKVVKKVNDSEKRGKKLRIVFPPLKDGEKLSMAFLLGQLPKELKHNCIVFTSVYYSLHSSNVKSQREMEIMRAKPSWEMHKSIDPLSENEEYVFIDDILTGGTTAKAVYQFINESRVSAGLTELSIAAGYLDSFVGLTLARTYSDINENSKYIFITDEERSLELNEKCKPERLDFSLDDLFNDL